MRPLPNSTSRLDLAVIEVDRIGTGTLRLGGEPVDHIVAARPGQVARALLDYTSTVGRGLTVLTQYSDGCSTMHKIRTNGTVTTLTPAATTQPMTRHHAEPRRHTKQHRRKLITTAASRIRVVVAGARTARTWLVHHGLWLMLCTELLMFTGCIAFIALAPHLWARP